MFQSHCKWSRQFICFIRVSKVFIGYDLIISIWILKNWIIRFEDQPTCNRQQSHRHRRNKRIVKRNIYLFAKVLNYYGINVFFNWIYLLYQELLNRSVTGYIVGSFVYFPRITIFQNWYTTTLLSGIKLKIFRRFTPILQ